MIPNVRAWDNVNKEMIEDVASIHFKAEMIVTRNLCFYPFKDIERLQSTGLLDKNGTEIFEGDIVSAMSEGYKAIGVVKRRIDGYWLMYPAWQNGQSWKLVVNEQGDTDVEIIGNKFEHPHLLGED